VFLSDRAYEHADTLRYREDLYIKNADGTNFRRLTHSGFVGANYVWIDPKHLIYVTYKPNPVIIKTHEQIKKIVNLNTKTGNKDIIKDSMHVGFLWIFWDSLSHQLIAISKKDKKLPVNIDSYNLQGNILKRTKLDNSILKTALDFNFYWKTKK
jgi:hypothetical protein